MTEENNASIVEPENISICTGIFIVKNYGRVTNHEFSNIKMWHIQIEFCGENRMKIRVQEENVT